MSMHMKSFIREWWQIGLMLLACTIGASFGTYDLWERDHHTFADMWVLWEVLYFSFVFVMLECMFMFACAMFLMVTHLDMIER